jgi:hypothetical protein
MKNFTIVCIITMIILVIGGMALISSDKRTVEYTARKVVDEVENFYDVYGLRQTQLFCEDAGRFRRGDFYFRCTAYRSGLLYEDEDYSIHHVNVFVYTDSLGNWPEEGLTYMLREVLRVPHVPYNSEAWGPT